jgi:hypothetical protein
VAHLNELEVVQNAALGAGLLWRFGMGYQEKSLEEPAPLLLHFIVLPICLHQTTLDTAAGTRKNSGLALFASKLAERREDLLAIHVRALAMRSLTLDSLGNGIRTGLLKMSYNDALVRANTLDGLATIPTRIKTQWDVAARLGYWCAGSDLRTIATLLRLEF